MSDEEDDEYTWYRTGPVTTLTMEILEEVCDALAEGSLLNHAAALAGVHRITLWRWRKRGEDEIKRMMAADLDAPHPDKAIFVAFELAVSEARARSALAAIRAIRAAGEGTLEKNSTAEWRAAAWFLEHSYQEYARTMQIQSKADVVVKEATRLNPDNLTDAARAELEEQLAQLTGGDDGLSID